MLRSKLRGAIRPTGQSVCEIPSTTPASLNPSNRNYKTVSDDDSANPVSSSNFSK